MHGHMIYLRIEVMGPIDVINAVLLVWRKCLYQNLGCVILSEFPSSRFIRSIYFSPFVEYIISAHEYYMFEVLLLSSGRHKGTIDVRKI